MQESKRTAFLPRTHPLDELGRASHNSPHLLPINPHLKTTSINQTKQFSLIKFGQVTELVMRPGQGFLNNTFLVTKVAWVRVPLCSLHFFVLFFPAV